MDPDFNILIVEDELVLQLMLEHMLKKWDSTVTLKLQKGRARC